MRVLVVGSGGREHALAWKISQTAEVFCAPGNGGTPDVATNIEITDIPALASFAEDSKIDLTVVGPEAPLVAGIADEFTKRGLPIFGPTAQAARLEGSKSFCRDFAERHRIPMAAGREFTDASEAIQFAEQLILPVVVKADGLAAGKGVFVCETRAEMTKAIEQILTHAIFGGSKLVVEEHLVGREITLLAVLNGSQAQVLQPAQDYKRAHDNDAGPNTGGMGAYSPVHWFDSHFEDAETQIVDQIVEGLHKDGTEYRGCLYAGLMITPAGPRLIEINCRFGDPETQCLVRLMQSDLVALLEAAAHGKPLPPVEWSSEACVVVVAAAAGYPGEYCTGLSIAGCKDAEALDGVKTFHAGTIRNTELVSSGGRVLNLSATGDDIPAARSRAYEALKQIRMDDMHFRTDIAL